MKTESEMYWREAPGGHINSRRPGGFTICRNLYAPHCGAVAVRVKKTVYRGLCFFDTVEEAKAWAEGFAFWYCEIKRAKETFRKTRQLFTIAAHSCEWATEEGQGQ